MGLGRLAETAGGTAIAALLATALPATAQDLMFPPGEGPFSWDSYEEFAAAHDYSGEVLLVSGASTGADKDKLDAVFAYFAAATGADVRLSGSDSFEQDVVVGVQAGSPPHIAMFPQPGLAEDLAARGALQPLDPANRDWFAANFAAGDSWADLATFADATGEEHIFGVFFGADVKSLVWYVPEIFEEYGYEIPETMEDLKALTEQMVEDGATPWCIGLGAGAATGWPATDWVEDMLLRTAPPEIYDQWVRNEIPFDHPAVVAAIEEFGWFARNEEFVSGGVGAVATSDFRDSPAGLFSFPPTCMMHKQASFIPNFFPGQVEVGEDVRFFYFPAYAGADLGQPVLGSGGLIAAMVDRPVAHGFIEFLKTPLAHELAIAQGQFLTAHLGANPDAYANEIQRAQGEILMNATTFRFDGSDLMPGEIGTSAFWTGMVDYVTGASAEDVAAAIQRRWDSIR